jgi:hypothetical protein
MDQAPEPGPAQNPDVCAQIGDATASLETCVAVVVSGITRQGGGANRAD